MSYLPDLDYSCGATFCDDPACNTHGPKTQDGELIYWLDRQLDRQPACEHCQWLLDNNLIMPSFVRVAHALWCEVYRK